MLTGNDRSGPRLDLQDRERGRSPGPGHRPDRPGGGAAEPGLRAGPVPGKPGLRYADIAAGHRRLRAEVPEGVFSLAVGADDQTAATEHAEVARDWLPAGAPRSLRDEAQARLGAARELAGRGGLGYLGVVTGQADGRARMVMVGIAATTFKPPPGVEPSGLLAALLRHQYPRPCAVVEEFETPHGPAVGVRRGDRLVPPDRPGQADGPGQAERPGRAAIETGISQALVIFPEADLLGTVTGFCPDVADIDLATVFTARIAHSLTLLEAPAA